MLAADLGAIVTIETIDTGGGGAVIGGIALSELEILSKPGADAGMPIGSPSALRIDSMAPGEALLMQQARSNAANELVSTERAGERLSIEWPSTAYCGAAPALEMSFSNDVVILTQLESSTSTFNLTTLNDTQLQIEIQRTFSERVSGGRILRSPGRRRALGRYLRIRVLKGS